MNEVCLMKWSNDKHNRMIELRQNKYTWKEVAERMTNEFGDEYNAEQCRARWRNNRHKIVNEVDPIKQYGIHQKRNQDGTIDLRRLIEVYSEENLKDDEFIIRANGFDPDAWDLVDISISMWDHLNKKMDEPKTLYANKIKLKPKVVKLSDSKLLQTILGETKPIELNPVRYKLKDKSMLGIYFMDMHFGINTLEDYEQTLTETIDILQSKIWDEVLITFGSDLMHVDNLNNTTANQTRIQDVDHVKMIEDVKAFYEKLVKVASKQANHVKVMYIAGNHDQTVSALLIHWLHGRFNNTNNVTVDYSIQEVKIHTWEQILVALSHGDKGGKRRKNAIAAKHPVEWANAKVRELYTGHLHREASLDEFGIIERTLPTRAKTDKWHADNSFEGAHKRFQLFEYNSDRLKKIYYV